MHCGPSPLALPVIRSLLRGPRTAIRIATETRLNLRTVRAQLETLRKAGAAQRVRLVSPGSQSGAWAEYELEVIQLPTFARVSPFF